MQETGSTGAKIDREHVQKLFTLSFLQSTIRRQIFSKTDTEKQKINAKHCCIISLNLSNQNLLLKYF